MKKLLTLSLLMLFVSISYAQTWKWVNPKPTFNITESIFFTDVYTGYMVGEGGTILKTADGGITWATQNSGTSLDLYSVYFANAYTGYAVGASGTILKTTDGGDTWVNSPQDSYLYNGVTFPNPDTGYVIYSGTWPLGNSGMLKTIDGGVAWNPLTIGSLGTLEGVYFLTSEIGFIYGQDNGNYDALIRRTTDGGITWADCYHPSTWGFIHSIDFISSTTGFAVGQAGTILKTTDAGATWNPLSSGATNDLYSISFPDENNGYATGVNGTVLKTINGGVAWTKMTIDPNMDGWAILYPQTSSGFIIGQTSSTPYHAKMYQSTDAGSTYQSMITGTIANLFSVSFPDANNGFAVGDSGRIVKTADGGESWSILSSGTQTVLTGVSFSTANNGCVVGKSGKIMNTTDGGVSWQAQVSGTTQNLNAVTFLDGNNGWIAGDWGTILKTTNGGSTWTAQNSGTSRYLQSIDFVDANTGFAVGTWGTILKTTDGGSTWTNLETYGEYYTFTDVFFIDENNGFVVGNISSVLKTTDGGITWIPIQMQANSISSIYFQDQYTGYIVGDGGSIQLSNDGGVTWTLQQSFTNQPLNAVFITKNHIGITVGYYGTILKTSDIGVGVTEPAKQAEIRILPNPAEDKITIEIPNFTDKGTLMILTMAGQEVMTFPITESKTMQEISNLQSGMYLVKFTGRNNIKTGKLVKLD
jgi:photosystem II stability/assembly factor-like uncharacterized protein